MKKIVKFVSGIATAMLLAFGLTLAPVSAYSAPSIEDVEYEGNGRVDVEFWQDVSYRNCKVKVKDTKGNSYKTTILERDDDGITFRIKKYKTGRTYNFTVKGVKVWGTDKYKSVKGKVKIPSAGKVVVRNVEYDGEDRQVEFEFKGKVKWSNDAKVTITKNGRNYSNGIIDWDNDSVEVSVDRLKYGAKYNYKITGVGNRDGGSYKTVKGTFYAHDWDD